MTGSVRQYPEAKEGQRLAPDLGKSVSKHCRYAIRFVQEDSRTSLTRHAHSLSGADTRGISIRLHVSACRAVARWL